MSFSHFSEKPSPKPPVDPSPVPPDGENVIPEEPVKPVEFPNEVPAGPHGGGGVAWQEGADGGVAVVMEPGGGGVGMGGGQGAAAGGDGGPNVAAASVGLFGGGDGGEGARAGAVAGAFLGILVAASSIMWAAYKMKPGILGGAGSGAAAGPMNISSPSSNYPLVKSQTSAFGTGYRGGGGGAGAGNAIAMTAVKVEGAANGAAVGAFGAGRASAGTQTTQMMAASMFSDYPAIAASGQYATLGAMSGLMAGDGIVTRAVQTDLAYIAGAGAAAAQESAMVAQSASSNAAAAGGGVGYSENITNIHSETHVSNFSSYQQNSMMAAAASAKSVATTETQTMPEPTAATPLLQEEAPIVAQRRAPSQSQGYSADQVDSMHMSSNMYSYSESRSYNSMNESSSMSSHHQQNQARTLSPEPYDAKYSMQVQSMSTSNYNGTNGAAVSNNLWAGGETHSSGVMMASEEIRVDCVHLTADGRHVVTGSIFGPPQVWDLRVSNQTLFSFTLVCFYHFVS